MWGGVGSAQGQEAPGTLRRGCPGHGSRREGSVPRGAPWGTGAARSEAWSRARGGGWGAGGAANLEIGAQGGTAGAAAETGAPCPARPQGAWTC